MSETATVSGGSSHADDVKEKVSDVAGQAQEKAQGAAVQVKDRVREQVDQRSTQAGEKIGSTTQDLRAITDQLRDQGKTAPADLIEQAADRTDRLGDYLTRSGGDDILRDVEDLARRQPWTVVAAGLALGFTASRLLKASSAERYRSGGSAIRSAGPMIQAGTPAISV